MSVEHQPPAGLKKLGAQLPVDVSAQHCLWFTWADDVSGPYGEQMVNSRPTRTFIHNDAVAVTISVDNPSTSLWRHGGGAHEETTAEGRTDGDRGTKPAYKSATYNSGYIYALPMPLNGLVAMFGTTPVPTYENPAVQKLIGLQRENLEIPNGKNRFLVLGMHDGYQWNNNELELTVNITWWQLDDS